MPVKSSQLSATSRARGRLTLVVRGEVGHRREYIELFKNIAQSSGHAVAVEQISWKHVLRDGALFSPMLEEHTFKMLCISTIRRLLGRPSAALLFRIFEAHQPTTARQKIKRLLLQMTRLVCPGLAISIVPTPVNPGLERLAAAWIYDPQLWDLADTVIRAPDTLLVDRILEEARGRSIVAALGGQDYNKGFDYFSKIWTNSPELRLSCLFVACGAVAAESRSVAQQFEELGGFLIDRFITDSELRAVYATADLIWSCYAPEYNQASGIFGRAHQAGVRAIIREGSALEGLSQLTGSDVVLLPWDHAERAAQIVLAAAKAAPRGAPPSVDALRQHSLRTLEDALGLTLQTTQGTHGL